MSESEGEQVEIPAQVLEGLEFVRASGEANMFDIPRVAQLALRAGGHGSEVQEILCSENDIQMMLLLTDANNIQQCQRSGCQGIIPPGKRKDRIYCSDACKQWVYENKGS